MFIVQSSSVDDNGDRESIAGSDGGIQMVEPISNIANIPGLPGQLSNNVILSEADLKAQQLRRAKAAAQRFGEHWSFRLLMALATIWTLYEYGIQYAGTRKNADYVFTVILSIFFFLFIFEIFLQMFYNEEYFSYSKWKALPGETWSETWYRRQQEIGSFYFWLDILATATLILDLPWIITEQGYEVINGGAIASAQAGTSSLSAIRAARVVRVVRMVRLVRMGKLYKYLQTIFSNKNQASLKRKSMATARSGSNHHSVAQDDDDEDLAESRVGAAMSDLTNRRVIVLILMMSIIIPLLTPSDSDISESLAVQALHALGDKNATNPDDYSVGLQVVINSVRKNLPVLEITFNDMTVYRDDVLYGLRNQELNQYELSNNNGNFSTFVAFDAKRESVQSALYSIYTTVLISGLLVLGSYFFQRDVQKLVIGPIERLVNLVRKISINPLGVEYKILGAKDGFVEGMETTILLSTITKIGGLMRVGFGEAGAAIIAKNMSSEDGSGGKLNLLGSGAMIHSIFGFCDVRQFTDTTECLQEEVMLFVNRIAHILHSVVVQCSGAANKNIGDAFLLTWKLDEKMMSNNPEQISVLADQALLTFCKALVELSRYQEFICNFSLAATTRLLKRFPDYNVRIGCGLHVGWAIEGAIGSNRKIDASYLSPHVSATEYLESSTKQYGVSLLLSEPFYRLLSPAAAKHIRQVDRVKRNAHEEPMGLYTYDSDLNINWNDPHRHKKKDPRDRLQEAAKRALRKRHDASPKNSVSGPTRSESAANHHPHHHHGQHHSGQSHHHRPSVRNGVQDAGRRRQSVSPAVAAAAAAAAAAGVSRVERLNMILRQDGNSALDTATAIYLEDNGDLEAIPELDDAEKEARAKQTPTIVVPPYTQNIWDEDLDLVELRHRISDAFRVLWEQGMHAYIKGDWQKARDIFHETMRMSKDKDGPSKFMIQTINEHGGAAPLNWPGYRDEAEGGH